jgi:predicted transcriptional regulator
MGNLDNNQNLLSKLRSPLHLDYISDNILKMNKYETLELLNDLISQGLIEEKNKMYRIKKLK